MSTIPSDMVEMDYRKNDGYEIWLLWMPADNKVFVRVKDDRDGTDDTFEVPNESAKNAFHHPFAYKP